MVTTVAMIDVVIMDRNAATWKNCRNVDLMPTTVLAESLQRAKRTRSRAAKGRVQKSLLAAGAHRLQA